MGDVAFHELGHSANLKPTEGRNGFEHDKGAAGVASQMLELHVAEGDHDLEGIAMPPEPDRRDIRASVLAVGHQHGGRWTVEQRADILDPFVGHGGNL